MFAGLEVWGLSRVHIALRIVDGVGVVAALRPSQLDEQWLGAWLDGVGSCAGAQRLDRPAVVSGGVWRSPGGACRSQCSVSRTFLALLCSQGFRASPVLRWHSLPFFPSILLISGLLPFWSDLGRLAPMRRALLGINASVVGILLAALFQPVWQTGIRVGAEFSLALVAGGLTLV